MSSVAVCAICLEVAWPIFEDLRSIPGCNCVHVCHAPCLQQWMEDCPAGRDPTCPSCKRSISLTERIKVLESQVAVNLLEVAVHLKWVETAEAATVLSSGELARYRQDVTRVQEELMRCSLELEEVREEIRDMEKVHEQTRWNRFFRVIRVLLEDRENWPWNLLEAYVLIKAAGGTC